jgi:integrase
MAGKDMSNIRIDKAWDLYLIDKKKRLGEKTGSYTRADYIGRIHLMPTMKNRKLSTITNQDWQDIINDAKPVRGGRDKLCKRSLTTIRGEITAFRKFARKSGYIDAKWEDIEIPKNAPTLGRNKVVLQKAVLDAFICDSSDEWYLHLWQLQVTTGMRPGEACGLQPGDIDGEVLTINRSINRFKQVRDGKNDNAKRTFVLTPLDLYLIDQQKEQLRKAGIISPWLFCDPDGCQPNPIVIGHAWEDYRKRFPCHVTQYGLRHTWVSHNKDRPGAPRSTHRTSAPDHLRECPHGAGEGAGRGDPDHRG